MIGLSNAPISSLQLSATVQTVSNNPPGLTASLYDGSLSFFTNEAQQGGGTLYYPLDSPKYIMTFTISKYNRDNLNSIGTFQAAPGYPGIVLPLPENMVDTDSVNWEELNAGVFTGNIINGLAGGGVGSAASLAIAAGAGATLGGVSSALTPGAALLGSLVGLAPNQFVTLLMRGPRYKRHQFKWTFAPHNYQEADQLRQIIQIFRNGMAPGQMAMIAGAPALWTYPKIFYIRLYPNSMFMYKFKPAIINALHVSYTPANKAAFLRNGNGPGGTIGGNPPAIMQMQMELIELEFWTEGNYDSSNNPDQSTTYGDTTQLTAQQLALATTVTSAVNAVSNFATTAANKTSQFFNSGNPNPTPAE